MGFEFQSSLSYVVLDQPEVQNNKDSVIKMEGKRMSQ